MISPEWEQEKQSQSVVRSETPGKEKESTEFTIFICYRRDDGAQHAAWLTTSIEHHLRSIKVFVDDKWPLGTENWVEHRLEILDSSDALIVIVTPGITADQRRKTIPEEDHAHEEIDWWLRNRQTPPIVIDTTGNHRRWIPEGIRQAWPNAQLGSIPKELKETDPKGEEWIRLHQALWSGVARSGHDVVKEDMHKLKSAHDRLNQSNKKLRVARAIVFGLALVASVFAVVHYDQLISHRQLASIREVDALVSDAESLWPARPDKIGAIDAWLLRYEELVSEIGAHERALSSRTPSSWSNLDVLVDQNGELDQDELRNALASMDDPDEQWLFSSLAHLVSRFRSLTTSSLREDVIGLRSFSDSVTSLTLGGSEARKAWRDAQDFVLDKYSGLRIAPRLGLLPLGPNKQGRYEFWHVQSGPRPSKRSDGNGWAAGPDTGLVFVLIPNGRFSMGAVASAVELPVSSEEASQLGPNEDPYAEPEEISRSQEEVVLEAFYCSKYEVTQGQWQRAMHENPSANILGGGSAHPVESVSLEACERVLRRLDMRIPTEAQWEYAARGGTDTIWWTGNELGSLQGVKDRPSWSTPVRACWSTLDQRFPC